MINLKEYLKQNTTTSFYNSKKDNYYIAFNNKKYEWEIVKATEEDVTMQYFNWINSSVIAVLNDELVTLSELRLAYKELGWL